MRLILCVNIFKNWYFNRDPEKMHALMPCNYVSCLLVQSFSNKLDLIEYSLFSCVSEFVFRSNKIWISNTTLYYEKKFI